MIDEQVYDALRLIAGRYFDGQPADHTLEPTALVNEAWLKLAGQDGWNDRTHFLAVGARAMKQILVDHARSRRADKRGGNWKRLTLSARAGEEPVAQWDLLALNEALERLHAVDRRQARMIELRFFAGLSAAEIATICDVSRRTVELDLRMARAWLARALADEPAGTRNDGDA